MKKYFKNNKKALIIFCAFTLVFIYFLTKYNKNNCLEKTEIFFSKLNNIDNLKLDYSLAKDIDVLEKLLGTGYKITSYKNNNCYSLVQNYNPQINEYRYSILNVDNEVLESVLIEHDLINPKSDQYKQEFIEKYNRIFK